jgi:hypothetical protein
MLVIKPTTSNTSPDPGQGGVAVTGPTNTGHASTTSSAAGDGIGDDETKTCIWSGIANVFGPKSAVNLKITHTSDGTRSGATGANQFTLEYSLNGGGAWNVAVSRTNMTSAQGPTVFSVGLSVSQDLTQVRVRDFIQASAFTVGHSATAIATISDIQVEVITLDDGVVSGGM